MMTSCTEEATVVKIEGRHYFRGRGLRGINDGLDCNRTCSLALWWGWRKNPELQVGDGRSDVSPRLLLCANTTMSRYGPPIHPT